ncbi:hypothetical protein [Sphingobacterium sp. SGL-16]|uniref:hypothetical protein n=1 Tax=Sphingobacterium sp. SGL-16 TaxID=2710883 RepID=UPI0013EBBB40|nr:hypothetical protein [Sphingobacterium sp. SGL-16]NGM71886.1 hypothetical protein [Sphingobacterium sp. SGL-16]
MKISTFNIYALHVFSIIVLLPSCKTDGVPEVDSEKETLNVQIAFADIIDNNVSEIQASANPLINQADKNNTSILIDDGFVIETENTNSGHSNSTNNLLPSHKNKNSLTAATPLNVGIKLRLLLYEVESDGSLTFKANIGAAVQQNFYTTSLVKNTKYKYFAYSYNNFDEYPPSPQNENNPIIPTSTKFSLIYASGDINVQEDPVHVNVLFRHITSRISIGVDAQSYFANSIKELKVSLDNVILTTHNLNLFNGTLVGGALTAIPSDTSFLFANFENSPAKKLSIDRIYTSTPLNSYTYKINRLVVNKNGADEVLISETNPRTITASGFTGPLSTVYFSRNYIYPAKNFDGDLWATGNLYYNSSALPESQYVIDATKTVSNSEPCNYYFNWNTLLSRSQTSSTTYDRGDPCSKVYPYGKWKTPSQSDYQRLIDNSNLSINGNGALLFTSKANSNQVVTFHQAGWQYGASCLVTNVSDGQYWTSTTSGTSKGIIFETGNTAGSPRTEFDPENRDIGASIRCIRN